MSNEIIITVGPSSIGVDCLQKLKKAGATNFRINLSHATTKSTEEYINKLQSIDINASLDTQGAQLRTASGTKLRQLKSNEMVKIGFVDMETGDNEMDFYFNHKEAYEQIQVNDNIRIDFEGLTVKVKTKYETHLEALCINPGNIKENKAVDVINRSLKLNPLTQFDKEIIRRCAVKNIEKIYLSFANNSDDVLQLKELMKESGYSNTKIVAKIETVQALANLNNILDVVDGVLIDRGDLSREISISKIPHACDVVLSLAKKKMVPCYVATNVLETMIQNPLIQMLEAFVVFHVLLPTLD